MGEIYNIITMARRFFDGTHDEKFPYMMLSRLIMDCEYYKGHPQHKQLWAGNPQDHEAAMREAYDLCPIKPEWCSREQLEEYISMLK
jgi:hypothetical protein